MFRTFKFNIIQLSIILSFVVFLVPSVSANNSVANSESCTLENINNKLGTQAPLNYFEQTKTIKVLSRPLHSEGFLLLSNQQSLVWQTTNPIKSTTVIDPSGLKQYNKNDQLISLPAQANNPVSHLVSSTFLEILTGDLNEMTTNFNSTTDCNSGAWNIVLTPTHKDIKQAINKIHLSGSDRIQTLSFVEANDDQTMIKFSPIDDKTIYQLLEKYLVD